MFTPALPSRRYSGLHVLSLSSPAVGSSSSALLQLLDSSHVIHGDGALVRTLAASFWLQCDSFILFVDVMPALGARALSSPLQVYGCAWLPCSSSDGPCVLSCSFYNKLLCMSRWRCPPPPP